MSPERPCLAIIDARSASASPLSDICQRATRAFHVEVVSNTTSALEVIAVLHPVAVLVHAGLDPRPGLPVAGPLLASLLIRLHEDLRLLLYTGRPPLGHERTLASLGVAAPVVFDQRLVADLEPLVSNLIDHAAFTAALRSSGAATQEGVEHCLPSGFRIERFLAEVERALLQAALNEHPSRTSAAEATLMPVETFSLHLRQHGVALPRAARPTSNAEPSLLWCSSSAAPPEVTRACETAGLNVRQMPPGTLHPKTLSCGTAIGAVVDLSDAAGGVDAWLLQRSLRPSVMMTCPSAPVRYLLEELHVRVGVPCVGESLDVLLQAGRCTTNLRRDEEMSLRLPFGPCGAPAWPLDVAKFCRRLDGRVLRLARQTTSSVALAAQAVGLAETTFRTRLAKASMCA